MCLQCKVPTQKGLSKLDSFDLAFLTLTGHVEWVDPFDAQFLLLVKATSHGSSDYLWGPQADLMGKTIGKAWKKIGVPYVNKMRKAFDLRGNIKVDREKLKKAQKAGMKMGKEMWLACGAKVRDILDDTVASSERHFNRQRKKATKADEEDWRLYLAGAMADHVAEYMEEFPERILHPEITKLVKIVEQKPDSRVIDLGLLKERIQKIDTRGESYFALMSDVQVGRTWVFTGLEMAQQESVTEYVIIAELDQKTCPVCQRLHGQHFPVKGAYDRMERALATTDIAEITGLWPFPRVPQLDNRSPEEIRDLELAPPFHGRCRCDVQFLWK